MLEHLPAWETPQETQDKRGPGHSPGQQPGPHLCPWHPLPNHFLTGVHADVHVYRQRGHLSPPRSLGHGQRQALSHRESTLHISCLWGGVEWAVVLHLESLCVISQVAGLCCSQFISAMPFSLIARLKNCCWHPRFRMFPNKNHLSKGI